MLTTQPTNDTPSVDEYLKAAAQNPSRFLSLCLGKEAASLQTDLLCLAMEWDSWYAEMPRGHAKTSTLSYLVAWWLGVRPETRFKIVSQNDDAATATSRFIREIVRGPAFQAVFPKVRLSATANSTAWSVEADGIPNRRDTSVQASGIFGRTGGRADIIWFDDICDLRNSILQPALREQVKEAAANIWLPMLDPSATHGSRVWRSATPFHIDDITAKWRNDCGPPGALLRTPCMGDISPWPDVFTPEILKRRKDEMGALAYARAYELVPISSDLLIFRPEWLGLWSDLPPLTRTIAAIDWGYGSKRQGRNDPDYSVCIVAEVDKKQHLRLTDILRVRETFPTFAKMASDLCSRRRVSVILAEANGPQRGIFDAFMEMTHQPTMEVARTTDKNMRAAAAQPFIQGGRLMFPSNEAGLLRPEWQDAHDEMVAFPAAAHDDCVDCIVDLCMETIRGHISPEEIVPNRIQRSTRHKLFNASEPKRRQFNA